MGGGVDRFERCDEEAHVEMQRGAGGQPPGTRVVRRRHRVCRRLDADAATAIVVPGRRQVERLAEIEVGVERPLVVVVSQDVLQAFVDAAQPDPFLVVLDLPRPVHALGPPAARAPEPEHVLGSLRDERNRQCHIVDGEIIERRDLDPVVEHAVVLEQSVDAHAHAVRPALGRPGHAATALLAHDESGGAQALSRAVDENLQRERAREHGLRLVTERHVRREETEDPVRKPRIAQNDGASEDRKLAAVGSGDRDGHERLDDEVRIGAGGGVEPCQPAHQLRFVEPVIDGRGIVHLERDAHRPAAAAGCRDDDVSLHHSGRLVARDEHAHPQGLHGPGFDCDRLGERASRFIDAAAVEAGERPAPRLRESVERDADVVEIRLAGNDGDLKREVLVTKDAAFEAV